MTSVPAKPWSVATFEEQRPHLTRFIRDKVIPLLEDDECRRIVIRAPVKSGKREMVEYVAMRDLVHGSKRVHAFLSAWHRAADEEQRMELAGQNMAVFSITDTKKTLACLGWITGQIAAGKHVVIHLDECDHGSGSKQMLSMVWEKTRSHENITNILYSATPQEVLFSGEIDDAAHNAMMAEFVQEGFHVKYDPPSGYCGPVQYLAAQMVQEAKPFFYKEGTKFALSPQGREIVRDLRASIAAEPSRNLIVLRLSYADLGGLRDERKDNKAIYQFLRNLSDFEELADFVVVVDKGDDMGVKNNQISTEKIQWSSPIYWRRQAIGIPTIVVIDQTSSRSTEWACHNRVFATHDFRNQVIYSVISQAQERVNHYEQKYGGFQRIRVYGHMKTFLLSAGQIDYATYLKQDWEMKKIDKRVTGDVVLYRVKNTNGAKQLHPICPETGMTEEAANRLLQDLGCYADVSVSARVCGRIVDKRTYLSDWQPVTHDTWDTFWPAYKAVAANGVADYAAKNPFVKAAAEMKKRLDKGEVCTKWLGQHRGWKVLDYERDIMNSRDMGSTGGNRIKLCYKGDTIGVAIVRCTGSVPMNTLRAYKSMYVE